MLDDIGERGNVPVNWNYFVTAFTHSRVGHYEEAEDYLEAGHPARGAFRERATTSGD